MRQFIALLLAFSAAACSAGTGHQSVQAQAGSKPNILLVFLDDAGYGDVGYTGATTRTPTIDTLAKQGAKLDNFYVAQAACSASRAALLTGMYPNRFDFPWVLYPGKPFDHMGLPPEIETLPEYLVRQGYYTAMFGKWHLGHHPAALPPGHGFNEYLGIPYSADMASYNPNSQNQWPPLPLLEGTSPVIEDAGPEDQKMFTRQFTDRTIDVIERHRDSPWFVYLAYNQPHVMLYASEEFEGKSGKGLYRDVMHEIDASLGRIMDALDKSGQRDNSLVIVTSDNGPWMVFGDHGGSNGPFREEKGTSFEGGAHMFGLMHWPARIRPGTRISHPTMTIDIFATIAGILGGKPANPFIDGRDILDLPINDPSGAVTDGHPYYFYKQNKLEAIRIGRWKLVFPHTHRQVKTAGSGGLKGRYRQVKVGYQLYDVVADPGETTNLLSSHPDLVEKMKEHATSFETELARHRTKPGKYD